MPPFFLRDLLNSDSHFYLHELDEEVLDEILQLSFEELDKYIYALICRFYPNVIKDSEKYVAISNSYKSGFILERLYRSNPMLSKYYTAIYTKTGLVRELVLDLYAIGTEKVAIH